MPWTVHLEGGPRRVNHAAVSVADKIYSFGGYCTGDDYRNKRPMDVHVLNTGESWLFLASSATLADCAGCSQLQVDHADHSGTVRPPLQSLSLPALRPHCCGPQ